MHPVTLPSTTPLLQYSIIPIFSLSMANRAASEPLDLVFLHEFLPKYDLIRGRLPIHVENLFPRPNEALRIPMAFETPLHI
jgi:hypothetical protein